MSIKIVMKGDKLDSTETVVISRPFKLERVPTAKESKKVIKFPSGIKVAEPVDLWFDKIA